MHSNSGEPGSSDAGLVRYLTTAANCVSGKVGRVDDSP